jgi:hypothetical protein
MRRVFSHFFVSCGVIEGSQKILQRGYRGKAETFTAEGAEKRQGKIAGETPALL